MYLLAIETTGAYASVALLQAGTEGTGTGKAGAEGTGAEAGWEQAEILGVIHGNDRFSHLQNLTPQIDQILKDNQSQIGDVGVIAVSHGPGSFTGIRIGVATARALSQILGVPCVAVSSLEALALRAKEIPALLSEAAAAEADSALLTETTTAEKVLVCPALDARRKQVYGGAYEIREGCPVCMIKERSILMVDFLKDIEKIADRYDRILFLGDGIDTCGELIEQWAADHGWALGEEAGGPGETGCAGSGGSTGPAILYAPEEIRYQDAAAVALRGLQMWAEGKSCDYMELQPEYLRMAEAEKKLREKQK